MKTIDQIRKIDLHMHSVISDGTDTPSELLRKVKKAGIDMFSVTDHDAITSAVIIRPILSENDPVFISGVEFSCKDGLGKYHILGYGYDIHAQPILSLVAKGHALRVEKLGKRLELLKEQYKIAFSDEDIQALYANNNPGKPHIAKLMVKYGYVKSISEAFKSCLNQLKVSSAYFLPQEAIEAITQSGGIPVLAHPVFGSGDELYVGEKMEERLVPLLEYGLKGLEGYYSGYSPKLEKEVLDLAEKYDLYITSGSDYHGENKFVKLGETNLDDVRQAPEGMFRFLEAVLS